MNKKEFVKSFSGVRSSEQTLERIMNMTETKSKRTHSAAKIIAAAACLALLVSGIFGGSVISGKIKSSKIKANLFSVTAYAVDERNTEKKIDLNGSKAVNSDLQMKIIESGTGSGYAVECNTNAGFRVEGKDIKTVTYSAGRGSFSYHSVKGNDFGDVTTEFTSGSDESSERKPYATKTTISDIGENEIIELNYNPEEAIDTILKAQSADFDFSSLPTDIITISVEFTNGEKGEKSIQISFSEDGYMLMKNK